MSDARRTNSPPPSDDALDSALLAAFSVRGAPRNKQPGVSDSVIARRKRVLQIYGLTPRGREVLLRRQQHRCAICRRGISELKQDTLFVDHDHVTGKVRGLLCCSCNTRLAAVEDRVWIVAARRYLDKPPASRGRIKIS